jgi:hypothetical protein
MALQAPGLHHVSGFPLVGFQRNDNHDIVCFVENIEIKFINDWLAVNPKR